MFDTPQEMTIRARRAIHDESVLVWRQIMKDLEV